MKRINIKGNEELLEQQVRLTKAKAEHAELKTAILRGEYVLKKDADKKYNKEVKIVMTKMLGLPTALAQQLSMMDKPRDIQKLLDAEIREAFIELAK